MKKIPLIFVLLLLFSCKLEEIPDIEIEPPQADFETIEFSNNRFAPSTVTFNNTSTNADSYSWNFGDGTTSEDVNPVHTFLSAGVYDVTLTARHTPSERENEKIDSITIKPVYTFARAFNSGSGSGDTGYSIVQTSNDGYAITGRRVNGTDTEVFLLLVDAEGKDGQFKHLANLNSGRGRSIIQTRNGGLAITGVSYDWSSTGHVLLVITDANGEYYLPNPIPRFNAGTGYVGKVEGTSIIETSSGGFAIVGYSEKANGMGKDALLILTDDQGQRLGDPIRYDGGPGINYEGYSIVETSDGGFAITGRCADINEFDLPPFGPSFSLSNEDILLILTDANGKEINKPKRIDAGKNGEDEGTSIIQTNNGGLAIVGPAHSGNYIFLLLTDKYGQELGPPILYDSKEGNEEYISIVQASDNRFVITGYEQRLTQGGERFFFIIQTDSNGVQIEGSSPKAIQGVTNGTSIIQTSDGGFAFVGNCYSDLSGVCLIKTDANGDIN